MELFFFLASFDIPQTGLYYLRIKGCGVKAIQSGMHFSPNLKPLRVEVRSRLDFFDVYELYDVLLAICPSTMQTHNIRKSEESSSHNGSHKSFSSIGILPLSAGKHRITVQLTSANWDGIPEQSFKLLQNEAVKRTRDEKSPIFAFLHSLHITFLPSNHNFSDFNVHHSSRDMDYFDNFATPASPQCLPPPLPSDYPPRFGFESCESASRPHFSLEISSQESKPIPVQENVCSSAVKYYIPDSKFGTDLQVVPWQDTSNKEFIVAECANEPGYPG